MLVRCNFATATKKSSLAAAKQAIAKLRAPKTVKADTDSVHSLRSALFDANTRSDKKLSLAIPALPVVAAAIDKSRKRSASDEMNLIEDCRPLVQSEMCLEEENIEEQQKHFINAAYSRIKHDRERCLMQRDHVLALSQCRAMSKLATDWPGLIPIAQVEYARPPYGRRLASISLPTIKSPFD